MKNIPTRIALANTPTKIEKLERLTAELGGPTIWIKRDDQTGLELSGNKVRKLEFAVKEAIDKGCDTLITCGGIQSNHARATAAAAAKLGLGCVLVLVGKDGTNAEGNHLLDLLLGADVRFVSGEEYGASRGQIMEGIVQELKSKGKKGYILPEGASNGIGAFGYAQAMAEIKVQEETLGVHFDGIASATGSGGTYAGLLLGAKNSTKPRRIVGFAVGKDAAYFETAVKGILKESHGYTGEAFVENDYSIEVFDGYVGEGYAISRKEELEFLRDFGKLEGVLLDPVYTGKAMYGLVQEIKKGTFRDCKNILFIHTGGLYGLLGKAGEVTSLLPL